MGSYRVWIKSRKSKHSLRFRVFELTHLLLFFLCRQVNRSFGTQLVSMVTRRWAESSFSCWCSFCARSTTTRTPECAAWWTEWEYTWCLRSTPTPMSWRTRWYDGPKLWPQYRYFFFKKLDSVYWKAKKLRRPSLDSCSVLNSNHSFVKFVSSDSEMLHLYITPLHFWALTRSPSFSSRVRRWGTGLWATGLKKVTTSSRTSPTSTASCGEPRTEAGSLVWCPTITSPSQKTPSMALWVHFMLYRAHLPLKFIQLINISLFLALIARCWDKSHHFLDGAQPICAGS